MAVHVPLEAGVPAVRALAHGAHVRLGAAVPHAMPPQRVVGAERLVTLVAAVASPSADRRAVAAAVLAALVLVHVAVRPEALRTVAARVRLVRIVQALVHAQILARLRAERTAGAGELAHGAVRGHVRRNGAVGLEGALANLRGAGGGGRVVLVSVSGFGAFLYIRVFFNTIKTQLHILYSF